MVESQSSYWKTTMLHTVNPISILPGIGWNSLETLHFPGLHV